MAKELTGRIAADRVRMMQTPAIDPDIIAAFKALGDPVGQVADSMDELGIAPGVIGTHELKPTMPGAVVVGPALTVRNITQRIDPLKGAAAKVNKMAEFEAHNLASPGDVLVIQGVSGISNMGGISAQTGHRQGEAGAIIWGAVRDIGHSQSIGYPVWATERIAVTGKWRLETVEINGPVQIGQVRVEPGDLVLADETSVAFVPRDMIETVLATAQKKSEAERIRVDAVKRGVSIKDLINANYGEKEAAE